MQITYDNESFRSVAIDEATLTVFLKEHGAKKRGLSTLEIRLCMAYLAPLEKLLGTSQSGTVGGTYCREENLIELYLYPLRSRKFLNEALIHESRHFIQFQQGEKYDWDEELYLPYHKRPSEIDAHVFTKKHKKLQFLSIDDNQLLQKQVKSHFSQYWS
jgi:hypothetical protein